MKTKLMLSRLLLAAIVALFISSCSSNDDDPQTTEERIRGVWKVNRIDEVETNPGNPYTYTYIGEPLDYFDFRADGKVYQYWDGGHDTFSYRLWNDGNADYIIEDDIDTFRIMTLTNNSLIKKYSYQGYSWTEDLKR